MTDLPLLVTMYYFLLTFQYDIWLTVDFARQTYMIIKELIFSLELKDSSSLGAVQ